MCDKGTVVEGLCNNGPIDEGGVDDCSETVRGVTPPDVDEARDVDMPGLLLP